MLDEVTTFVELAMDGAYIAGDRRVHRTERSKWRLTFRQASGRRAGGAAGRRSRASGAGRRRRWLTCL